MLFQTLDIDRFHCHAIKRIKNYPVNEVKKIRDYKKYFKSILMLLILTLKYLSNLKICVLFQTSDIRQNVSTNDGRKVV